jgi:hypothetical protein
MGQNDNVNDMTIRNETWQRTRLAFILVAILPNAGKGMV